MKQRIPLAVYAARRHTAVAAQLGMSQGALSKAIRNSRAIFVLVSPDGTVSAIEERPFPSQRPGADNDSPAGS